MAARELGPAPQQAHGEDRGRSAFHRACHLIAIAAALVLAPAAFAQDWPAKPIRIIVPFPAGGAVDPLVRGLSSGLAAKLGQPVLVENRPGATGTIGMAACAKSPPDGYTLCFVTSDGLTVVPHLRSDLPFDAARDFAPVTLLGYPQSILVASERAPFDSFAAMVAYAKRNPGKINFGTFGEGGISHQLLEAIQQGAGVKITNVPYKGTGPAIQAALANEVDLALSTFPVVAPHFPSGKLRPLAVIGRERLPALPNVPTYREQKLPIDIATWFAIMAPGSVPKAIRQSTHEAIAATMAEPGFRAKVMPRDAYDAVGSGPDEFERFLVSSRAAGKKIAEMLKAAGYRPE
ncbi:MAG TPA: tripartite tricarboxylate transporter substrate-binding protein [Burkholderiales bacterium]